MRNLLYLLLLVLAFGHLSAQTKQAIEDPEARLIPDNGAHSSIHQRGASFDFNTITDTLELSLFRRSSIRGILLNTSTSALGMAQYVLAPGPVVVHGFEFYAYQSDPNFTNPVTLTCKIYKAANKLPTGQPLAQVLVSIPKTTYSGLPSIRKTAKFTNPVVVNGPFVIVIETASNINVSVMSSNWETGDGEGDFFAGMKFGTNWSSSQNVTVSGIPFDADFFLSPFVTYDFSSGFQTSQNCLSGNDSITFINEYNNFVVSKFFNRAVAMGKKGGDLFTWDFGQGGGFHNVVDTSIIYTVPKKYLVSLQTEFLAWRRPMYTVFVDSLDIPPAASFSMMQENNSIAFTNTSTGLDYSYWDFGDSTYSTLTDPIYHYFRSGNFTVTLVVKNGCGSDTATWNVNIQLTGLAEQQWPDAVRVYPVPANDVLHIDFSGRQIDRIQMLSMQGQLIADITTSGFQAALPVSNLPSGPFMLRIMEDGKMYHRMVLKL